MSNDDEIDHWVENFEFFFILKRQMYEAMTFIDLSSLSKEMKNNQNFNNDLEIIENFQWFKVNDKEKEWKYFPICRFENFSRREHCRI